jgi:uncharacterized membrane protein
MKKLSATSYARYRGKRTHGDTMADDADLRIQEQLARTATGPQYDVAPVGSRPPGRNPRSTASIAGHPLHPMLIPFPIAFFVATFACDVAFWVTGGAGWFTATMWLLGAGLIFAGLAAVAGLTDFLGEARIRALGTAWWHAGGNVLAVAIEIANIFLRDAVGPAVVLPTGIVLSGVVVGILLFTGWMGWEMVYRGRVAVAD